MAYCFIISVVLLNALIGALAFEWAWAKVKPIRLSTESTDSQYKPFRRYDMPKWRKFKFYISAVTLMPFKFCLSLGVIFFLFFFVK